MNIHKLIEKHIGIITLCACFLILMLPFILTRSWLDIDFLNTGQIGDTIGGTTAPAIGMITILLIYLTFNSQKKELKKTQKFLKKQTDSIALDQTLESIENMLKEVSHFINEIDWDGHKGIQAIRNYHVLKEGVVTSFLDEYNAILITFEILISTANTIDNDNVRKSYLSRIYTLFYSKIFWNTKMKMLLDSPVIIKKNDDAQLMMPKYIKLSLETLDYMVSNRLSMQSQHKLDCITQLNYYSEQYEIILKEDLGL